MDINFFYWASGIIITIIFSYITFKFMNKIKDIKIEQKSRKMKDVTGVNLKLSDGENIHIKNMTISQVTEEMQNVKGLDIKVSGKQSARLQGVEIKQPNATFKISDDPNVQVIINKQD